MRRMYDKEEIKEIAAESGSKVDSLDLVVGEPTVTYDTTDGITIESTGKLNGTDDIVVSNEIPIVAGEGISIDKAADKEQIIIKSTLKNLNYAKLDTKNTFTKEQEFTGKSSVCINTQWPESTIRITSKDLSNYFADISANEIQFYENSGTGQYRGNLSITRKAGTFNNHPAIVNTNLGGNKYTIFIPYPSSASNVESTMLTDKNVKTIFGNQSIYSQNGSGNIDLYCHNITFQDKVYFTGYSSKSTQIDSLTDLQTVFPDDVWKSATGSSADDTKTVCAINCHQMKLRYSDNTESSLAEYSAPIDTVTTI